MIKDLYTLLFNSPNGEMVLADLKMRFYDVSAVRGDSFNAAVAAGEREVILFILSQIKKGNDND